MALDPITAGLSVVDTIGKLLERIIPDPAARAQAQLALATLQSNGELEKLRIQSDIDQSQADVNKMEAGSSNLFVAGWRPAVGWCCVVGVGIQFLGPLLTWGTMLWGKPVILPAMDSGTLMPLLLGMLGLGGMRTFEKTKGVA